MTHRVASSETEEQKIVMRWARVMQSRYPALENLYHVPNEAKRSRTTASVLKAMGLRAGATVFRLHGGQFNSAGPLQKSILI